MGAKSLPFIQFWPFSLFSVFSVLSVVEGLFFSQAPVNGYPISGT